MEWTEMAERMEAALATMEAMGARWTESQTALVAAAEERVGRIVATVESEREAELQRRLEDAEAKIAQLEATSAAQPAGRKTVPAMVTKQGALVDGVEAGSLDAALASLSIEQRIAVKAELLRTGAIG